MKHLIVPAIILLLIPIGFLIAAQIKILILKREIKKLKGDDGAGYHSEEK